MTNSIGIRELQQTTAAIVKDIRDTGTRRIITWHGLPAAALVPMRDYERLEGEVSKEPSTGPTYKQMDEARRAALVERVTAEIAAEVRDTVERARIVNEVLARLLTQE